MSPLLKMKRLYQLELKNAFTGALKIWFDDFTRHKSCDAILIANLIASRVK